MEKIKPTKEEEEYILEPKDYLFVRVIQELIEKIEHLRLSMQK